MERREFIKLTAMAAATATASRTVLAQAPTQPQPPVNPSVTARTGNGVTWDKAPCRFCGTAPALAGPGRGQLQGVWVVRMALRAQAQAGGVEEAARSVEPGGADRGVAAINRVIQRERRAGLAGHFPAALAGLHHRQRATALTRPQALEVSGEFTDQVAAGNPCRQAQALHPLGLCDGQGDPVQVGVRLGHVDPVTDRRRCLGRVGHGGGKNSRDRCSLPDDRTRPGRRRVQRVQVPPAPNTQASVATTVRRQRSGSQCDSPASAQVLRSTA